MTKGRKGEGSLAYVGLGPGARELVTLRAAELLRAADVAFGDEAALALAHPLLSKSHEGRALVGSPAERGAALASLRAEGRAVVRVVRGDVSESAAAFEELRALSDAREAFEIAPGLSFASGAAAYAGLRLHDASLLAPSKGAGPRIARVEGGDVASAFEALRASATEGLTEVTAIFAPTTPEQRVATYDVEALRAELARGTAPPSLLVADADPGARALAWFEALPLFGRRVVVTRAAEQSSGMVEALRRLGAEPIALPTIETVAPASYADLDAAIADLGRFHDLVFTSPNGVRFFAARLDHLGFDARRLAGLRLCCIGPGTADALRTMGLRADLVAREFKAEGLVAEMMLGGVAGRRILVARAEKAREVLLEELRKAGAEVVLAVAYRTLIPEGARAEAARIAAGTVDALTFTSASTVTHFVEVLGAEAARALAARAVIACIGPITRDAALRLGLRCDVMPTDYTIDALVRALAERFAARPRA